MITAPSGTDQATIRARLAAAADDLEAKAEAAEIAREVRDRIVVEAVEAGRAGAGWSTRDVARWARISQSRVQGILADH